MFGSVILEVAIGLILIYLVMSLIMTSVQEALQAILKTRARNLEAAILELLQGDSALRDELYNHPLIYALHRGRRGNGNAGSGRATLPSYIPRETFAAALLDLVPKAGTGGAAEMRQAVRAMEHVVGTNTAAMRGEIERWYDAAMDRASGRFKRHSQLSLFILAMLTSLLLNVNSITLAQYLAVSPQQRQLVTALAERISPPDADGEAERTQAAEPPAPTEPRTFTSNQIRTLTSDLYDIGLPIGWSQPSIDLIRRNFPNARIVLFQGSLSGSAALDWAQLVAGYLITAFAIMLGAPFWFDVLNKFMVIRATVKPKEKSPDEASEDGGGGRGAAPAPAAPQSVAPPAPRGHGPAPDRPGDTESPVFG